jgi:hypothetical protein
MVAFHLLRTCSESRQQRRLTAKSRAGCRGRVFSRSGEGALYVGGTGSAQKETPAAALQLPFEVMSAGDFEPHYRLPLDVQGGEMPVIPMSVYGSVVMGRGENYDSDPAKFFFYLCAPRCSMFA